MSVTHRSGPPKVGDAVVVVKQSRYSYGHEVRVVIETIGERPGVTEPVIGCHVRPDGPELLLPVSRLYWDPLPGVWRVG